MTLSPSPSRPLRALFCLAAGVALVAGCGADQKRREVRVSVTLATVARQPVSDALEASGTVEPRQTVDVNPQVGGLIESVRFREGDEVRAGQVLFVIDRRPYQAALEQAKAALQRDRAQAETARLDFERSRTLSDKGYLAPADFDTKRSAAESARATVRSDSAEVARAALDLENCTVRAPIEGRTGKLMIHAGNLVKANTTDAPLVTINQVHPILVRFTVAQQDLDRVLRRRGQRLDVLAGASLDSAASRGQLSFIDNAVDAATGTLLLKGEFPNKDGALWPGEFVRTRLVLATDLSAVVIPSQAVTNGQSGGYVFVLNPDTTVSTRPVRISRVSGDLAVVESGVTPGERVVVDGQLRLSAGARVSIKPSPGAAAGGAPANAAAGGGGGAAAAPAAARR